MLIMERKVYNEIGLSRLLNIRVIKDDVETLYEGMVEDAPEDIKLLKYSKIQTTDRVNFYVYSDLDKGE